LGETNDTWQRGKSQMVQVKGADGVQNVPLDQNQKSS